MQRAAGAPDTGMRDAERRELSPGLVREELHVPRTAKYRAMIVPAGRACQEEYDSFDSIRLPGFGQGLSAQEITRRGGT